MAVLTAVQSVALMVASRALHMVVSMVVSMAEKSVGPMDVYLAAKWVVLMVETMVV